MENINWVDVMNTIGVIGVLFMFVWMFLTGKIVPMSVVDRILTEADNRTIRMTDEIKAGIKEAVREGIVEGIHEIRNDEG